MPIRRFTISKEPFWTRTIAPDSAAVLTVDLSRGPGASTLQIGETSLLDGASRSATSTLPSDAWNVGAAARLGRPTALLLPVGDLADLVWAELADGAIDSTAVTVPPDVSYFEGSTQMVSDGEAFLSITGLGGGIGLMRVTRSGANVVALESRPGARAYHIAPSPAADVLFIAASSFGAEPRVELATIAADGSPIRDWVPLLDGELFVRSLAAMADGIAVTAASEDEVVIIRLDASLTELERLHLPLDHVTGAWIIDAATPALLATRTDSPGRNTVLFGHLPTLSDLRSLADSPFEEPPVGWVTEEGSFVVAVPEPSLTHVYVLCEAR